MTQIATRSLTFASGDLRLEGALHLPDATPAPAVVVCHPHPLHGGDMDNNVVVAACEALGAAGVAAFRFNFRGTGGSEGAHDEGDGERDDLRAALRFVAQLSEVDASRLGVAGYSFGAMVASEVASSELRGLALISPPLQFSDMRVGWGCPAIMLAGDEDSIAPGDRLRIVAERAKAELRLFEGVDHSWWGYERELGEALTEFFGRQFA